MVFLSVTAGAAWPTRTLPRLNPCRLEEKEAQLNELQSQRANLADQLEVMQVRVCVCCACGYVCSWRWEEECLRSFFAPSMMWQHRSCGGVGWAWSCLVASPLLWRSLG